MQSKSKHWMHQSIIWERNLDFVSCPLRTLIIVLYYAVFSILDTAYSMPGIACVRCPISIILIKPRIRRYIIFMPLSYYPVILSYYPITNIHPTHKPTPTTNLLITSSKLFINTALNPQSLPITPLHLHIQTQTPQKMAPLRMLQKRLFQIHIPLFNKHIPHTDIFNFGVFLEFGSDWLDCCLVWDIHVVDC